MEHSAGFISSSDSAEIKPAQCSIKLVFYLTEKIVKCRHKKANKFLNDKI